MIKTARLLLRPMRAQDADELLGIFADPIVMASFGGEQVARENKSTPHAPSSDAL